MVTMRKKLMELVDLGEPTSFPDLVYLGCTSRECKPNKAVIEENRKCSNHEFLLEQLKYALRLSKKSLHLARMGVPNMLWSVNKLSRTVTKMDKNL